MATHEYKGWKYIRRVDFDAEGRIVRHTINFYRKENAGGWYDHIRYESHEIRKGKDTLAPHLHLKMRSGFKRDDNAAIEEIQTIIDNQVKQLERLLGK